MKILFFPALERKEIPFGFTRRTKTQSSVILAVNRRRNGWFLWQV